MVDKKGSDEGGRSLKDLYLQFTETARPLIVRGMIMSAFSCIFGFVPYFVAVFIAQAALRGALPDTGTLALMVVAGVLCAVVSRFLFAGGTGVCHRADAEFRVHARHILIDHFARLPLGWFNDRSSGEVKQAVSDDILGMHQSVGHAPSELTFAFLTPLIPLVYLFIVDWRLAGLLVVYLAVLVGVSMVFMMRDYSKLNEEYNAANVELSAAAIEMAEGIEVVKTFGGTSRANDRYREAVQKLTDITYEWTIMTAGPFSMLTAFISPGIVLALFGLVSFVFVSNGWADFATCVPFLVFAPNIPSGFVTITSSMGFLRLAKQNLEHLATILAVAPLFEPENPRPLENDRFEVAFDQVEFSYSEDGRLALNGIDARLEPGTVTALVGDSGSGKTTFARLIPRFWDPSAGAVSLGGIDLRAVSSESVLRKVAVVFQESMMLSLSLRDNIRLAHPDASDEEVERAAVAAQIHERIMDFPQGYDTLVGSAECNLSGGEAQRVAIARAIIQDAPVLVLDEATAHADPENETAIQEALANLARGRTTVVIAHRLNTIVNADAILVMEEGRVVESGRHDDLLSANGRYAALWRAQQVGETPAAPAPDPAAPAPDPAAPPPDPAAPAEEKEALR